MELAATNHSTGGFGIPLVSHVNSLISSLASLKFGQGGWCWIRS